MTDEIISKEKRPVVTSNTRTVPSLEPAASCQSLWGDHAIERTMARHPTSSQRDCPNPSVTCSIMTEGNTTIRRAWHTGGDIDDFDFKARRSDGKMVRRVRGPCQRRRVVGVARDKVPHERAIACRKYKDRLHEGEAKGDEKASDGYQ
jgi:hypothetical protein